MQQQNFLLTNFEPIAVVVVVEIAGNIHVVCKVFVGKLIEVVVALALMFVVSTLAWVWPIENVSATTQEGLPIG